MPTVNWIQESGRLRSSAPCNAMSVDVEDYFQVLAFEPWLKGQSWDAFECRIPRNVERILALFEAQGVRATFFTLGWVAQKFPQLVRRIADGGHEIASHGYEHARVTEQTPEEFRADVTRTRKLLQDVSGQPVNGYRAASFSIGHRNLWALDVLQDCGHLYSSSIYPIRHDFYGMPGAPRFAFRMRKGSLLEVPVTTVKVLGRTLPCGGGGYFRLLPYRLFRSGLKRVNAVDGQPGVFYFHPWEIDPDQPRIGHAGFKSRFRHYLNLGRMERRLTRLLGDFRWDRMDRVFLDPLRA